VRAGPTAARQLADWGADVIQVQMPEHMRGDDTLGGQDGSDYQYTHRNKRSVTLNLKEPEGIAALKRLIGTADVVIENFRPDVKFRLGIDYETLAQDHPRLVYASISGFGQTGPLAQRPGFDQIAQGMGGLMSVTGLPGQGPVRVGIPIADLCAGIFAAQGILVALLERETSGKGPVAAHLAAGVDGVHDGLPDRALAGRRRGRSAGRQLPPHEHPHRRLQGARRLHEHRRVRQQDLGALLHARSARRSGSTDPRFHDKASRSVNRDALNAAINERLAHHDRDHWIEHFNRDGVACGHINDISEVFDEAAGAAPGHGAGRGLRTPRPAAPGGPADDARAHAQPNRARSAAPRRAHRRGARRAGPGGQRHRSS
jgi:crotonobetainyl-CoA:carnitine CoA-transferase CaiB-like acyl-CoA transferase